MTMKLRSVIAAIAALSILIIPGVQNAQAAPSRYITVNAEGTVKVTPNAVKVMGQVTVVEGTNGAALAKANSTSAAVRKAATTSLTVYPEYNYTQEKGSVQIGYRASQSFTIVVKNAANAGAVVDAIAAAGGDFLQLQGVSPFVLDNSKATEAARSAAVKNAKAKAISYSKLLGVKLGKVNYLTEGGATYNPPIYGVAKASADEATVIDLGTQDVSVSITVQWALI
ncbi:MAG: hypothetical protein RLY80_890 [Actinomycetota bacterium]